MIMRTVFALGFPLVVVARDEAVDGIPYQVDVRHAIEAEPSKERFLHGVLAYLYECTCVLNCFTNFPFVST